MFDADRTETEYLRDLRTCLEGTELCVAEHNGRYRFGRPPYDADPHNAGDWGFHALSREFDAPDKDTARAYALGIRDGRRIAERDQ